MELFDFSDDYSSEDYDEFIKLLAFNSEDMSVPAPVAAPLPAVPAPAAAPRPVAAPLPAAAARSAALLIATASSSLDAVGSKLWACAKADALSKAVARNSEPTPVVDEPRKRQRAVKGDAAENMRKRGAACSGKRVTQRDVMDGEVDADVLFSSAAKMYKGLQKANKELVNELRELKDDFKFQTHDLLRERALIKRMQEKLVLYELRGEPPALVDLC